MSRQSSLFRNEAISGWIGIVITQSCQPIISRLDFVKPHHLYINQINVVSIQEDLSDKVQGWISATLLTFTIVGEMSWG